MTEHSVSTADQSGAGAMRAIRIHEHGGSDVLRAETVPGPNPAMTNCSFAFAPPVSTPSTG